MKNIRKKEGFKDQKIFIIPQDIIKETISHPLGEDLIITNIGFFPHAQYHYRQRKRGCKQHILIYCTAGNGFIEINKKRKPLKNNTLVFIPPDTPHIYGADENTPWEIYWAHFTGKKAGYYYDNKTGEISTMPIKKAPIITGLYTSIFDIMEKGYTIDNIIYSCQIFIHLLSTFLFFKNKDITADRQSNQINNSLIYMKENLNKNLSLTKLAQINNLSKSQLTLIFRKKTGHTPIDYFIRLKIQQACRYLDLTDYNIKEIADKLGYSDAYYFSRIFKKIIGMPPKKYREIKKG